jgi:hypothetical protein
MTWEWKESRVGRLGRSVLVSEYDRDHADRHSRVGRIGGQVLQVPIKIDPMQAAARPQRL